MNKEKNVNVKRLNDKAAQLFKEVKITLMKQYAENNDENLPNDGQILEKALELYTEKLKKEA